MNVNNDRIFFFRFNTSFCHLPVKHWRHSVFTVVIDMLRDKYVSFYMKDAGIVKEFWNFVISPLLQF